MRNKNVSPIGAILVLILVSVFFLFPRPAVCSVVEAQAAPDFTLQGLDGHQYKLSKYAGKPIVLFFFCGCKWCHDAARNWAIAERKGILSGPPHSVIVYSGGADEARGFIKQTGLDSSKVTLLLDRSMSITFFQYQAVPCPRVFFLSPEQKVLYTNDHKDDAARTVTGAALVTRIVSAIDAEDVQEKIERTLKEASVGLATGVAKSISASTAPTSAPVLLTPLGGNGVTVTGTGNNKQASYDFGTVKQNVTKTVEHVFQFRNDTQSTIEIASIQPSCDCTNAFIGENSDFPVSVKPGAIINVTAYVDLTDLYPAAVEKSVLIFTADQVDPVGVIEITGAISPAS